MIISNLKQRISDWVDEYDAKRAVTAPCRGDILCEREGRRHKNHCLGRTVPMRQYVKGIKES